MLSHRVSLFFFFNDTATTEIYTLSLHDALPIFGARVWDEVRAPPGAQHSDSFKAITARQLQALVRPCHARDRKSTRLNSSHTVISYAVFCLKKKKKTMWKQNTTKKHALHNDSVK